MLFSKRQPMPATQTADLSKAGTGKRTFAPLVMGALLFSSVMVASSMTLAQETAPAASSEGTSESISLDDVAFSMDGKDFTNRDLAAIAPSFAAELQNFPADKRRESLIDIIINSDLIAKESEKEKLHETEDFKLHLEQLKKRALRDFYIKQVIRPQVTDELAEERYVELLARFEPQTQIRARHILVETKEAAAALIVELDDGKDFAELARQKSTGPSAPNGGDLGFFNATEMIEPFKTATSTMTVGQYSKEPVKSQFGWHVLKLEETRQSTAPTYEQSATQLKQQILNELYDKKLVELRKDAKIEIAKTPEKEEKAE